MPIPWVTRGRHLLGSGSPLEDGRWGSSGWNHRWSPPLCACPASQLSKQENKQTNLHGTGLASRSVRGGMQDRQAHRKPFVQRSQVLSVVPLASPFIILTPNSEMASHLLTTWSDKAVTQILMVRDFWIVITNTSRTVSHLSLSFLAPNKNEHWAGNASAFLLPTLTPACAHLSTNWVPVLC